MELLKMKNYKKILKLERTKIQNWKRKVFKRNPETLLKIDIAPNIKVLLLIGK